MGSTSVLRYPSVPEEPTRILKKNAVANNVYVVNRVLQLTQGRNSVATVPLTWREFATVAAATVAAFWHANQLTPIPCSSELDCSDLL